MPVHRPEDVQRTHAIESLGALARDIAHPVAVCYRALREHGLDRRDARVIAIAFMRTLLARISPTEHPKP